MVRDPLFWSVLVTASVAMEFWAMLLHGRLWHGPWWPAHKSHHTPRIGLWEANDVFAAMHASVAIVLIVAGLEHKLGVYSHLFVAAGYGMTAFGIAYFVVHDGLIHGRLPVAFLGRIPWLRRVRNAHRVHHRLDAAPYGLFLGPNELRRATVSTGKAPRDNRA